jgi:hypothetical protein
VGKQLVEIEPLFDEALLVKIRMQVSRLARFGAIP